MNLDVVIEKYEKEIAFCEGRLNDSEDDYTNMDYTKGRKEAISELINELKQLNEATVERSTVCVHPFMKVISVGNEHNCTLCGKNI